MLYQITSVDNVLLDWIKDDPVRPEIPATFRVQPGRCVFALVDDGREKPAAMVCVSLHDSVPQRVDDLQQVAQVPTTAIFYTIWSYRAGSGRELLFKAVEAIRATMPTVTRFVTLSPKTEMARRFHLKNGAVVLQENETTVNYEYIVATNTIHLQHEHVSTSL